MPIIATSTVDLKKSAMMGWEGAFIYVADEGNLYRHDGREWKLSARGLPAAVTRRLTLSEFKRGVNAASDAIFPGDPRARSTTDARQSGWWRKTAIAIAARLVCLVIERNMWLKSKRTDTLGRYQKLSWDDWSLALTTGPATCRRAVPA